MQTHESTPFQLYFEVKSLPPSLNQMLRGHWRTRSAMLKKVKNSAICEIVPKLDSAPRLSKYSIVFTRHTSSPLDIDNLAASFKPVMDALTVTGVIKDDKWAMTENVSYRQVKTKRADHKISVLVKELN